ncbi:F-box only protein 22-like [Actinia tenebrosa]|uniref:F-box only protein 22-like n=1 Tax=Actinia tenebrosa TaxID=6105 RepID=A0A6P8IJT5_ACTTE|nr:F-box only protein 22-like [Actinia tenebrosa]
MADEVEALEVPAKCLTQMADIVENILSFAPGRSLESAASVCMLWREIIQRIRKTRRDCVTLTVGKLNSHKPCFDFSYSLTNVATEPQAALLFTHISSASAPIPPYMKDFSKYLRINQASLPRRCVLVGCGTLGIYHLGKNSPIFFSGNNLLSKEDANNQHAMVLFPRALGVQVCSFHVPLRNKYKSISGIDSFLPVMEEPVKLVLVLAHPLSLGKLTNFAVNVKKKYGGKTVIAGCYSDCVLFHQSTASFREIVGLVFAGDLVSASIVINSSRENEILENLHKNLVRLKSTQIQNTMALMFRPPTHQHVDGNMQCRAFQHHFPGVPVVVVDGSAVYGCDTVELERSASQAGGRDFLHTQSTILCMFSLSTTRS